MTEPNPPPPTIGTKLVQAGAFADRTLFEVRAIVDAVQGGEYAWEYQIVLLYLNNQGRTRYMLVNAHDLGMARFKVIEPKPLAKTKTRT